MCMEGCGKDVFLPLCFQHPISSLVVWTAMAEMLEGCGVNLAYHAEGKLQFDGCANSICMVVLCCLSCGTVCW